MKISHSALEDYAKCGELFRLKRIIKNDPRILAIRKQPVYSLVLGTIVHTALEGYYLHGIDPLESLKVYWQAELANAGCANLAGKLEVVGADICSLLEKASPKYVGPGAIRTKGGNISAKPQSTPAWGEQAAAMNLESRCIAIDQMVASNTDEDSPWRSLQFTQVYAESIFILTGWKNPSFIKSTIAVEKAFNLKFPLNLPVDIYFTGKIDLICKTVDGKTAIVDHKTSGGDPPPDWKVGMNDQLLLYAFAHFLTTGEIVDYIAIHHIRSKRIIPVRFELEMAEEVILRHEAALRGIVAESFVKQNPVNYGSACMNGDRPCPFLAYCHPKYFIQM